MTSRLALFDQTLSATLLQGEKAYKSRIKLKILERRGDAGEKELKFEISRADDFEFLFSATLNNEKYQELAKSHDLTVDFNTFPKVFIQDFLCKSIVKSIGSDDVEVVDQIHEKSGRSQGLNTEIKLKLDKEKGQCKFEIISKTTISNNAIFAMSLQAVRGDSLIAHLLKICAAQSAKIATCQRDSEELKTLREKWAELDGEMKTLRGAQEKLKELQEKTTELEDDLALVTEEKENIRQIAEEKEDVIAEKEEDIENLQIKLTETREELDVVVKMLEEEQQKVDQIQKGNVALQKENDKLRSNSARLHRSIEKFEGVKRQNDQQQSQQSIDAQKLRELETDLREKDSMVDNLTTTIGALKKELDDEKLKTQELMASFDSLRLENDENRQRLAMYRNQRFSPANGGVGGGAGGLQTTIRNTVGGGGHLNVLGPNSPYANPIKRTPLRDLLLSSSTTGGLTYQNSITPLPHQVSRFINDDTTGSSVTNTPPITRNPL